MYNIYRRGAFKTSICSDVISKPMLFASRIGPLSIMKVAEETDYVGTVITRIFSSLLFDMNTI